MNTCFYNIRLLSMDKKYRDYTGRGMGRGNRITYAGPSMRGMNRRFWDLPLLSGIVKSMEMAIFSCRALKMPILIPL